MIISELFQSCLDNLALSNQETITTRFQSLTKILNKKYWNTESETSHGLIIGSHGRGTAIGAGSDVDIIFELPDEVHARFNAYENNGQSALLQEVKKVIGVTYPRTEMRGDGQVVVVSFKDLEVELLPAFLQDDGSYKFPDTHDGGSWGTTKPLSENVALDKLDVSSNGHLRRLCKLTRAWRNTQGVAMGGLLIDTLCYNFLEGAQKYYDQELDCFHELCRDFFAYLADEDEEQDYWLAPGSNQRVHRKENFTKRAKKTLRAINAIPAASDPDYEEILYDTWRGVLGRSFPAPPKKLAKSLLDSVSEDRFDSVGEEFIEDQYPIDIRYRLKIECEVAQRGFRSHRLREMLHRRWPLLRSKDLTFSIDYCEVPKPYVVKWKVRNVGEEAIRRNQVRGQIIDPSRGKGTDRVETSDFHGPHFVECYIIKNGVCVARDRIDVPIALS